MDKGYYAYCSDLIKVAAKSQSTIKMDKGYYMEGNAKTETRASSRNPQ